MFIQCFYQGKASFVDIGNHQNGVKGIFKRFGAAINGRCVLRTTSTFLSAVILVSVSPYSKDPICVCERANCVVLKGSCFSSPQGNDMKREVCWLLSLIFSLYIYTQAIICYIYNQRSCMKVLFEVFLNFFVFQEIFSSRAHYQRLDVLIGLEQYLDRCC